MSGDRFVLDPAEGFEWDESKRQTNIAKHGIDFVDAVAVFDDPRHTRASAVASSERRFITIGAVRGLVIAVVFTIRNGKLRIISARVARRSERERYGQKSSG